MLTRRTLLAGGSALAGLSVLGSGSCSPPPLSTGGARIGMAAFPWEERLRETGPVQVRRSFASNLDDASKLTGAARVDKAHTRTSVVSVKVPSWAGAAKGESDVALSAIADRLDRLAHDVYLAVHHEPAGDGDPVTYAAMQARVLPMLKREHVQVCVIVNGFWFSHHAERQPLTDAERAEWLPDRVLEACDLVAADCYHAGTPDDPGREPDEQVRGLVEWSDRVGHGRPLGLGEFSGHTATAITNVGRVLAEQSGRFSWACAYNSSRNNRPGVEWTLTGERLTAFQALVAASQTADPE